MLRWISLAGIGLVAGALWRLEVEAWGWDGLRWLSYPHLAIPAGVLLFVAWVAVAAPLPRRRRAWTAGALLALGPIGYPTTQLGLRLLFVTGPSMLTFLIMFVPMPLIMVAIAALMLTVPVSVAAVATGAGLRLSWLRLAISFAVYFGAWPVAVEILRVSHHRGGADLIHALKSGVVIPMLVFALGILFLAPPRQDGGSPSQ